MGNDQKKPANESKAYHPDIVVVSKPSSGTGSSDANKLHYVPLFYPILKSSIDLKEDQALFQLNSDAVIRLSQHLEKHINVCAFNVTKDQEAINIEFKNLNIVIDHIMQNFYEKQKRYAKYCEHFRSVGEISQSLKKMQRSIDEIMPMLDEINALLPDEDQLEKFTF